MLNPKMFHLLFACFLLTVGAIMFVGGLLAGERTIAGLGSFDLMIIGVPISSIGYFLLALYYYNKNR